MTMEEGVVGNALNLVFTRLAVSFKRYTIKESHRCAYGKEKGRHGKKMKK